MVEDVIQFAWETRTQVVSSGEEVDLGQLLAIMYSISAVEAFRQHLVTQRR